MADSNKLVVEVFSLTEYLGGADPLVLIVDFVLRTSYSVEEAVETPNFWRA